MAKEEKILVSFEISKELQQQIKIAAEEEELSFSALIRTVMKNYLKTRHTKKK